MLRPATPGEAMIRVAILDDYQNVALKLADWSKLGPDVEVVSFTKNMASVDEAAAALADFDAVSIMRERMKFGRDLIERLPKLKLIVTTGGKNRSLDTAACRERGIICCGTGQGEKVPPTLEIAWALLLGAARNVFREDRAMRAGRWQDDLGMAIAGRTLGVLGLGNLGKGVARIGKAFGMDVIAWSQNLTPEKAAEGGATYVSKDELFSRADAISIHMVLSDRSRGLVGARELALMKPTAIIVNTSRGPIIDEAALISALREKRIRAAGLDVYDIEPLPADHPLRSMENVVLSPHLGYATEGNFRAYFDHTIEAIIAWRKGAPIRVIEE
jgi:D-3-phosphoglycerate dehydrogenase